MSLGSNKNGDLTIRFKPSIKCYNNDVLTCVNNTWIPRNITNLVTQGGEQGPPGEQGLQGPPGNDGEQGLQGIPGNDGEQGIQGPPGEQGIQGPPGNDGEQGPPGEQGIPGNDGDQGIQGIQGIQGTAGSFDNISVIVNLNTMIPIIKTTVGENSYILNASLLTPVSTSSSSVTGAWNPVNALVRDASWWMSGTDTGNEEWIKYDFGTPVLITGIYASFGNGRNGASNKIQGSTNNSTWVDIHTVDASKFAYNLNGDGQQTYSNYINTDTTYRYIRLYSAASPYCLYDFIQYIGVK
jgi:hypothetical protein